MIAVPKQQLPLMCLPPDLRVPWLILRDSGETCFAANCEIGFAAPVTGYPVGTGLPALLRDPAAQVTVSAPDGVDMEAALEMLLSELAEEHAKARLTQLIDIVASLAMWDLLFQHRGLFSGNVYLSSEAAAMALVSTAGLAPVSKPEMETTLSVLYTLELIYRFPVALKFRGNFGAERQLRLNCWGRRLVHRLTTGTVLGARADAVRKNLSLHLARHDGLYRSHMEALAELDEMRPGEAWQRVQRLPIGVLL